MKPLRIMHSEAATSFGGQENRIFKEMCAMRARGHIMQAVCQPHAQLANRLEDAGFTVHKMLMDGPRNYFAGVYKLRKILHQNKIQVLNTHSRRDTMLAGLAARLARTPLIVRTRHLAIKPGSLISYTGIPHRVTTVSNYVRNLLIERGASPDRVATVYSPIPLPDPVANSTIRTELNIPEDAVVVGCVAVMREKKGHKALIDAMDKFLRQDNVYLVLVGDGEPLFSQLKTYVNDLGLSAKILFTGRRNDIPNVLAGFDLFALATEQEASGTVFVEASAAGLPVIGTDVGGVSEMFTDGVSGLLIPPSDAPALEQALATLIQDKNLRLKMGQAGMHAVRESNKFSTEHLAEQTEFYYSRWLGELQK